MILEITHKRNYSLNKDNIEEQFFVMFQKFFVSVGDVFIQMPS